MENNKDIEIVKELKENLSYETQCITGRNKTAGGYKWVTKEQFESIKYEV